jgi:hypothetical protein
MKKEYKKRAGKRRKRRKREHHSKEQRRKESIRIGGERKKRRQVKRRVWTVNRSPHGNKTARDQRGREQWKGELRRNNPRCTDGESSWKAKRGGTSKTKRRE